MRNHSSRGRRLAGHEIRGGLVGGLAFNGLSLIAALIEIARGGVNLLSIAILGVSLVVTVGSRSPSGAEGSEPQATVKKPACRLLPPWTPTPTA